MATTLEIIESAPATFPPIPNLAIGIDPGTVWARLDAWNAWRWGERNCSFVVEGPGDWRAPLLPFSTLTIEVWFDGAFVSAVLPPSPLGGYCLESVGPYRFAGLLGDTADPPEAVFEAARRLGQFLVTVAARNFDNAILTKESSEEVDSFEYGSPNVAARAMQYSGAGDLLRRYRRSGAA